MRSSKTSGSMVRGSQSGGWRALKLAAVALGIGLVMSTGGARAADDDDDDDMTFEEKLIDNLMTGLGARSMEKPGIEYRERSPLVVPPKLDLPPPAAAEAAAAPNWPKDPDEKRRKEAIAQRKKSGNKATEYWKNAQPLSPAELNAHRTAAAEKTGNDPVQPGTNVANPTMSPAELGYTGGLWKLFKGNGPESKQFTSEPPRQSLVEPPPGYQTPSPNYAYGAGPDNSKRTYFDVRSGKEKEQ
ncbi:hypothetical protein I6F14_20110 [Bradyrhizobium sp. IC3069]|uniref:Uncharacterized protein n=1 Tax=Bradyrhizobium yuanmingense TaxID=108015 RepID=A0A0R3CGL9_9BRAD|nr:MULTISPECIES: hypothetical protein [Bradyrhizobium]KRP96662.1 hypothetical protein AOQ72_19180 [Bradyrhizobium yuanmingense]MCA1363294.1 hypothetical protein [Bradyrhizobium sp. IC4059]MCA1427534.1 hypothetical protein [Bradyrhizobium sp. NBAIM16]MCA1436032.1 hypothetical protein [Bradyrhizobium sp. BRP20]MCA1507055.1 hypothetical protein [Bradyrhizobium sp. NBAIM02]